MSPGRTTIGERHHRLNPILYIERGKALERRIIQRRIAEQEAAQMLPGFNKFGFYIRHWPEIVKNIERLRRRGLKNNWSENRILFEQAMLTTKECAFDVDHIVSRLKQTEIISTPEQENSEWARLYRMTIERFENEPRIAQDVKAKILREMELIWNYDMPPKRLVEGRQRHWKLIEKILAQGEKPEIVIRENIRATLKSKLSPKTKAFKICLAASINADYQERYHEVNWTMAYKSTMLKFFAEISKNHDVLQKIIEME